MVVPIDLLKPILDDLLKFGRQNPLRPWLGLYATEVEDRSWWSACFARAGQEGGPPHRRYHAVRRGHARSASSPAFRKVWSLGNAGVDVPLLVYRDGRTFEVTVKSGDRTRFLKGPSLH